MIKIPLWNGSGRTLLLGNGSIEKEKEFLSGMEAGSRDHNLSEKWKQGAGSSEQESSEE